MPQVTSYVQAREDHEYLWQTYGPAHDMTGTYEDQFDLHRLLKSPTKATATKCYIDQIEYWCQVGPERDRTNVAWIADPEVFKIAERYGFLSEFETLSKRYTDS